MRRRAEHFAWFKIEDLGFSVKAEILWWTLQVSKIVG